MSNAERTAVVVESNQGEVVHVDFRGDTVDVVRNERGIWVSTRRVCEALGLAPSAQFQKLKVKPWAVVSMIDTTGPDGKSYRSACIHLDSLPMWLATIDTNRVAESSREKLVAYQTECAAALRDHFFGHREPAPEARPDPSRLSLAERTRIVEEFMAPQRTAPGERIPANQLGAGSLCYLAVNGPNSLQGVNPPERHALLQLEADQAVLVAALKQMESAERDGKQPHCTVQEIRRAAAGIQARASAAARVGIW